MALIKTVKGKTPIIGKNVFMAENATIIGEVKMGDDCSVWFNTVIRGDVHYINIGKNVNIQDGAVIHCTYKKSPVNIGDNVSIAHNAVVHGCTIENNVLVGMGAIILDDVVVKSNSIVAAGAVVSKNTIIESGTVWGGIPARKLKDINPKLLKGEVERIANSYNMYASWFDDEHVDPFEK